MAYKNYIPTIETKLDSNCRKELDKWGFIAQLDGNRNTTVEKKQRKERK